MKIFNKISFILSTLLVSTIIIACSPKSLSQNSRYDCKITHITTGGAEFTIEGNKGEYEQLKVDYFRWLKIIKYDNQNKKDSLMVKNNLEALKKCQ